MSKSRKIGFQFGPFVPESPDTAPRAEDGRQDGERGPGGIEPGPVFTLPTGELVRMTAAAFTLADTGPGPIVFARALAQHFAGIRQSGPLTPGTVTTSKIHPPGKPGLGLVFFTLGDEPAAVTVVTIAEMHAADAEGFTGTEDGATVN